MVASEQWGPERLTSWANKDSGFCRRTSGESNSATFPSFITRTRSLSRIVSILKKRSASSYKNEKLSSILSAFQCILNLGMIFSLIRLFSNSNLLNSFCFFRFSFIAHSKQCFKFKTLVNLVLLLLNTVKSQH